MESLEFRGMDAYIKGLDDILTDFPEERKSLIDRIGNLALREVKQRIPGSGRMKGWQRKYVGSKGGYVAVRPIGEHEGGGTGKSGAGAITGYAERGHKIRRPGPTKPRIKVARVAGLKFYTNAKNAMQPQVKQECDHLMKQLVAKLEESR